MQDVMSERGLTGKIIAAILAFPVISVTLTSGVVIP